MTFNKKYFALAISILAMEVFIALFVNDTFVRPYVGDVLVIMLLYFFVKSFMKVSVVVAAISVLIFAFLIEFCQYMEIVNKLGLEHSKLARTVIGTSFSWIDLLCYTVGFVIILLAERSIVKRRISDNPSITR